MTEPPGFSWVIPDQVAAMSRPWDTVKALEYLNEQDIKVIISLTLTPIKRALIEEFGFEYKHIPIPDFHAPTPPQVDDFVETVAQARRGGKKVVVHCAAGRGRTGTMLACYLVSLGRTAARALEEVRALRPGSVETAEQEAAIENYARRTRQTDEEEKRRKKKKRKM